MSIRKLKYVCHAMLALAVFGLVVSMPAQAAKVINIANSVHNLSTSAPDIPGWGGNPYRSTTISEVCVFCHTPHSGNIQGPLWNRANPGSGSFTMYESARAGSATTVVLNRAVNNESLLCMSCHDGTIATNEIINPGVDGPTVDPLTEIITVSDGFDWTSPAIIGARIGAGMQDDGTLYATTSGHLEDDHPISMNMQVSIDSAFGTEFKTIAQAETAGVRFFNTSWVECSSCHDPHINYDPTATPPGDPAYAPFLVMPNTDSDLCYACHSK